MKLALVFALAFAGGLACGEKKAQETPEGEADKPAHRTKARGLIKNVAVGPGGAVLTIHHEAIGDWVNRSGAKMPMMSMSMDFKAGPKLDVGELATGDKIAFDVEVYYGENARLVVTSFDKLPADTALELSGH